MRQKKCYMDEYYVGVLVWRNARGMAGMQSSVDISE